MTVHRRYDGQILEREDYERKTYYEFEREDDGIKQVHEDDIEYIFECDHCGEIKEYSEVTPIGKGMGGHICIEHLPDEIVEAVKGDDNE